MRIWFDGVPIIEIGPLATKVLERGWEYRHSVPGEWWCEFEREFGSETDFDQELDELKSLFGKRWTRAE